MIQTETRLGVYIASKTKHGPRWEKLRSEGVPIVSTWINEYHPGATEDWADLWSRCVHEAATAGALILYREPGEVLKGAWLEAGAALAHGVPIYAVGCDEFNARHHPGITLCESFEEALRLATAAPKEQSMSNPSDILKTEFSEVFVQGMKDRMVVSFHKYGYVSEAYPEKVSAIGSLGDRLRRYAETGNTEFLIDAANFAMIEFMHPSHPEAYFKGTDDNQSPGRRSTRTGLADKRSNQEVGTNPNSKTAAFRGGS